MVTNQHESSRYSSFPTVKLERPKDPEGHIRFGYEKYIIKWYFKEKSATVQIGAFTSSSHVFTSLPELVAKAEDELQYTTAKEQFVKNIVDNTEYKYVDKIWTPYGKHVETGQTVSSKQNCLHITVNSGYLPGVKGYFFYVSTGEGWFISPYYNDDHYMYYHKRLGSFIKRYEDEKIITFDI